MSTRESSITIGGYLPHITIIRAFERKLWGVHLGIHSARCEVGRRPRSCRLIAVVWYNNIPAAHYSAPWVLESELVPDRNMHGRFCDTDDAIVKPLVKAYARATVGGAVKSARRWQYYAVKARLSGGGDPVDALEWIDILSYTRVGYFDEAALMLSWPERGFP